MQKGVDTKWFDVVWSQRKKVFHETENGHSILERLIRTNGFDSPLGMMHESDWLLFIDKITKKVGIAESDTIFEVGCGSGAFLYPYHVKGHTVSGVDYAPGQIEVARIAMPDRKDYLHPYEAIDISIDPKYDFVTTNQVIHFFPSLDYAETTIIKMLSKAKKTVLLAGVPDLNLKVESEKARRDILGPEKYEELYQGLENLYFDKKWLEGLAKQMGFDCHFSGHEMPGFAQNKFRFDAVMKRV